MVTFLAVWGAVWIVVLWLATTFRGRRGRRIQGIRGLLRRRPEVTAILTILAVAILGGWSVYGSHTGLWPHMVQFMLGGWPEGYNETLSRFQISVGVALQIIFTFGLPVLLVTVVYRRLTRRLEMRIIDFIRERDEVTATQIYLTYRKEMRRLAGDVTPDVAVSESGGGQARNPHLEDIDRLCWELANVDVSKVHKRFDELLPEDTASSLTEDRIDLGLEGFAVTRGG